METSNEKHERFLNSHVHDLELLALQFGIRVDDVETVIKEILSKLINASTLDRFILYQTALFSLLTYKDSIVDTELEIDEKKIFPYKEDEQFHLSLISMSNDFKIPFILQHFHGFSTEEITKFLNQSEDEINHKVDLANRHMMEDLSLQPAQFRNSLEFMKKTYSRIPEWIDKKHLFAKEEGEGNSEENNKDVKQKDRSIFVKQLIFVSLIIVFFSSLFFVSVTGAGQVDKQYIDKLEEDFEKTMEDRREQLGLMKEVYNQQAYISIAKSEFIEFKNELNRDLASGKDLKRNEVKKKFQKVLDSFELPSEMADRLFRKPLRNNEEESYLFLESYSKRLHEIIEAFNMESNSMMMESLPDDLQSGMESQNVSVSYNGFYYTTEFEESKFAKRLRSSLHPAMEPYIAMLQFEDQIYLEEPGHPSEIADAALVLEEILLNDTRRTYLYGYARNLYFQTFVALTHGPSIYRKDLMIKDEYREAWIELSKVKETSPMGRILSDVVNEMKDSGWTQSLTLRGIDTSLDLERALSLAKEGDLQHYQAMIRKFDRYENSSVHLPDESFQRIVVEIYKQIEKQVDLPNKTFFEVDPLFLVGAYDLAQRENNEKVLWHLTWKFYPYEKFLEQYEVGTPVLDGVDRITLDPGWIHYNRGFIYPILFERNGITEIGLWLSQNGPDWTIEKILTGEGD